MATQYLPGVLNSNVQAGYTGNVSHTVPAPQTAAVAIADVLVLARVPAGTRLTNATIIMLTANASLTGKVGYITEDGSTGTLNGVALNNDAALIAAGTALATAGRYVANAAVAPVVLQKDSLVVLTTAGGTIAAAAGGSVSAIVAYDFVGAA